MSTLSSLDYVRAFSQAAEKVLEQLLGEKPVRGTPSFQLGATLQLQQVNAIVGLTGGVKGQIAYGMDKQTALAVAGAMMMEEVTALDEMGISALSELSNMISGNATVILSQSGAVSDITPPSVVMGSSVMAAWYGIRAMVMPLKLSLGTLYVTVGLRPKLNSH
ncbi:MAG TPA: chemotaxis protein CheX [Pantanalinema sp.]